MTDDTTPPLRLDAKWRAHLDPAGRGPELLNLGESANKIRVAPGVFRRMARAGEVPAPVIINGRRMWRTVDLDAWIAEQTGATPPAAETDDERASRILREVSFR